MIVCHISDWHWGFMDVPPADLYVVTGDMYGGTYGNYSEIGDIDPRLEIMGQEYAARFLIGLGGFGQFLGSPDAPIVCVRGNHDFIPLAAMFEGCNLVHEFVDNEVIEVLGKRITGHRGIPFIHGTWSDEMDRRTLSDAVDAMPEADIFVTHYPPADVLDFETVSRGVIEHYGLEGMREALIARMGSRGGLHCFGHIHGCGGMIEEFGPGRIIGAAGPVYRFSNAACGFHTVELP